MTPFLTLFVTFFAVAAASTITIPAAGRVVSSGSEMIIEAGSTVNMNGMLVVEAGARLIARGTASLPINFIGLADSSGILLLGGSGDYTDTSLFTDLSPGSTSVPAYNNSYGGSVQPINVMQYCYLTSIGSNANDINGLTLVGLNDNHIFEYIKIDKAGDDGLEIFAGDVNVNNVHIIDAVDDQFDADLGWSGTVTNLTIQITSSTAAMQSLLEIGGNSPSTYATVDNCHFIDSTGENKVGNVRDFYTSTQNVVNVRTDGFISLNGRDRTTFSSNKLPLQVSPDGAYRSDTTVSTSGSGSDDDDDDVEDWEIVIICFVIYVVFSIFAIVLMYLLGLRFATAASEAKLNGGYTSVQMTSGPSAVPV